MNRSRLQMPEGIERDESTYSTTYGKFVIEPLERGFGVTLGNSLRRVLLSSIHGAAITHIRFDNVLHEYSTIPGIVEDVSELILNLKQVWIKLINKRPDKITIELKGAGEFKASDIQKYSPDIEILNPDLHLATLNDDVDVKIEIRIGRGRGYVPAEMNKKERFDHKGAANYLGIAEQTLYNWRTQRRGPDYVVMGRRKIIYFKIDLDKYIESHRIRLSS